MKRHKLNTPLNIQFTLAFYNMTVVFARSRCKTLCPCSRSGCDVSLTSQIPNTSLLLCLSAQLKSQTGVLRLVPCCDFSMRRAGENVLPGFELVKDGKRCARHSSAPLRFTCHGKYWNIPLEDNINAMNYKVTVSDACKHNRAPPPPPLLFIHTRSESVILLQGWCKHVRVNRKQRPI